MFEMKKMIHINSQTTDLIWLKKNRNKISQNLKEIEEILDGGEGT